MVVHAHGDNTDLLRRWVPRFEGPMVGTTQGPPLPHVHNFGGFSDGDRAAFAAHHLGAASVGFAGFDLDDDSVDPIKRGKLRFARRLLALLGHELSTRSSSTATWTSRPASGCRRTSRPRSAGSRASSSSGATRSGTSTIDQLRLDPALLGELGPRRPRRGPRGHDRAREVPGGHARDPRRAPPARPAAPVAHDRDRGPRPLRVRPGGGERAVPPGLDDYDLLLAGHPAAALEAALAGGRAPRHATTTPSRTRSPSPARPSSASTRRSRTSSASSRPRGAAPARPSAAARSAPSRSTARRGTARPGPSATRSRPCTRTAPATSGSAGSPTSSRTAPCPAPTPCPTPSGSPRSSPRSGPGRPDLLTLHIDNVNPGTIARHEEAARAALAAIVEGHTPGDVAAFGMETADPAVDRREQPEGLARRGLPGDRDRQRGRRGPDGRHPRAPAGPELRARARGRDAGDLRPRPRVPPPGPRRRVCSSGGSTSAG